MRSQLRRTLAVVCAAAVLSLAGVANAAVHPHAKRSTILDLDMSKQSLLNFHQILHAHLTNESGEPVPGANIRMFTPGHALLCERVTDTRGDATCDAPLAAPLELVNENVNGCNARFDGSDHYLPSEAHAPATLVIGDM
ncbi:hypothetical protein [Streptomyces sp. ISL-11]|uniref:hypothetical protein n=1 Tax=Streptomyces sp. ISL-11 TaxID=2819174 RepID=UPI001BEC4DC3|nr:hypothetical protein [Streptomyces sp. ISL-11]MBT2384958.1 hypothetical protein [Streptomyces sp. ISL-11]